MIDYVAIGRKIRMYRNQSQITQSDLAEKLNVSAKYISAIERGVSKVSLIRLDEIANLLNVKIVDLLADSDTTKSYYGEVELIELTKNWSTKQKSILIDVISSLNKNKYML
jgi:transcriptional regulator with XRE-family HTH domain